MEDQVDFMVINTFPDGNENQACQDIQSDVGDILLYCDVQPNDTKHLPKC